MIIYCACPSHNFFYLCMDFRIIWHSCSPWRVEVQFESFGHVRSPIPQAPLPPCSLKEMFSGFFVNLLIKFTYLLHQPTPPPPRSNKKNQIWILCEKKITYPLSPTPPPPPPPPPPQNHPPPHKKKKKKKEKKEKKINTKKPQKTYVSDLDSVCFQKFC